ncbi:MAG: holliday junction DNA helicase ruva [Ignavibacteria bacterium]|nr:MAG: holliday junction DNA helicase ruva [Ignavibacteria bacterium]KAF0157784.1 MAG: holliday junction DNA helicase ruva [Ignavibacteria bacterium]
MIGYISGKIISKKPTKILVDVNGVGYLINISISTFEKISEKEEVSLYTHLSVKEDALDLYGFYSIAEKEMFELLISVNGIGPKSAQGILSGIQIVDLKEAIKTNNIARLISIPGIGRKTAERLMIELRDKVESLGDYSEAGFVGSLNVRGDAITALVNLGYNQKTAERVVRAVTDRTPNATIEDLIKESLASLNS